MTRTQRLFIWLNTWQLNIYRFLENPHEKQFGILHWNDLFHIFGIFVQHICSKSFHDNFGTFTQFSYICYSTWGFYYQSAVAFGSGLSFDSSDQIQIAGWVSYLAYVTSSAGRTIQKNRLHDRSLCVWAGSVRMNWRSTLSCCLFQSLNFLSEFCTSLHFLS